MCAGHDSCGGLLHNVSHSALRNAIMGFCARLQELLRVWVHCCRSPAKLQKWLTFPLLSALLANVWQCCLQGRQQAPKYNN
eukprot:1159786-Pelagomonas_calceolata.AAC.3